MTTSGSTNYTLVTNDLIEEAFAIIGVASEGRPVSAYDYARGKAALNLMVKAWGASDHLWLRTEASVTLVASQATYALATLFSVKPGRVLSVRRRVTSGSTDTPLREMSRQEYLEQPDKTAASVPVGYYYDPQLSTGTLYIWPTASAATAAAQTLRVEYLRRIEDFDGSADDPDLPQEWLMALTYGLAAELALRYGINSSLRGAIEERAAAFKAQLEAWDTEPASVFLQPESYEC